MWQCTVGFGKKLTDLHSFSTDIGGVAGVVLLQGEVGHGVVLLRAVHQLRRVVVERVRAVAVVVAVAGETLQSCRNKFQLEFSYPCGHLRQS